MNSLGNVELLDARNVRLEFGTRFGDGVGEAVQNVLTTGFRLHQRFFEDFKRESVALDVHLRGSQTVDGARRLEVHVAEVILVAENVA